MVVSLSSMDNKNPVENRHVHYDVVPKDVDKDDVEFKRHVASIEAIQHERAGYLDAKGALDKGDAAFMIEQEEKRQHAINARDKAEKMAFYSLKSQVLTQDEGKSTVPAKTKTIDASHGSNSDGSRRVAKKRSQKDVLGAVLRHKKKRDDHPSSDMPAAEEGENTEKVVESTEANVLQGLVGDYGSDSDNGAQAPVLPSAADVLSE
ncbi:hypothetical protein M9434_004078 [Picochlorum sp. BPE23]|nr:hypothetical protein M9434_004078 [Picochlorum sp. BPE23]